MAYHLGIDLGTTFTAAAVWRDGRAEICGLGNRSPVVPSVVLTRADGTTLIGEAAERRATAEPERVAREFKRRIGDPTPLILGGAPHAADALTARLLRWVVDEVAETEGGPPASVAVAHPGNWGAFKQDLLHQAIARAELDDVVTVTEPEAAAVHYAGHRRVPAGAVVAVYDLGGGTFDAAVLRGADDTDADARGWTLLGEPQGIERLGGVDVDEAVFRHVAAALGAALDDLDPDDPTAAAAVTRLRRDCVEAKEALTADTDVTVPVLLPTLRTEVRLTRAELEEMVRPPLAESVDALRRALRSAQVDATDVHAVLLVGGGSRMPLVAQMVGRELGRPVAVDAHPKHSTALGAATLAAARPAGAEAAPGAAAPGDRTDAPVPPAPPLPDDLPAPTPPPAPDAPVSDDPVPPAEPVDTTPSHAWTTASVASTPRDGPPPGAGHGHDDPTSVRDATAAASAPVGLPPGAGFADEPRRPGTVHDGPPEPVPAPAGPPGGGDGNGAGGHGGGGGGDGGGEDRPRRSLLGALAGVGAVLTLLAGAVWLFDGDDDETAGTTTATSEDQGECADGPDRTVSELDDVTIPAVDVEELVVENVELAGETIPGFTVPAVHTPEQVVDAGCIVEHDAPEGCLGAVEITGAEIPAVEIPGYEIPAAPGDDGGYAGEVVEGDSVPGDRASGTRVEEVCPAEGTDGTLRRDSLYRNSIYRGGAYRGSAYRGRICIGEDCTEAVRVPALGTDAVSVDAVSVDAATSP